MAIHPVNDESIASAARILREGGLVAFPTETVYGLGANALDPEAVAGIFRMKGRPATNPVIVHVAERSGVDSLVSEWPENAEKLTKSFWPGPLTVVVRKSNLVPDIVTAGGLTVAIRCPAHPVALALLRAAGAPVAAPSANRSGELSPTTAEHVLHSLGEAGPMILDGGACPGGLESTVVDCTGSAVRLLRPGLISVPELERIVGPLDTTFPMSGIAASPGLMARHYSPRTALECAETAEEAMFLANLYRTAGLNVAMYSLAESPESASHNLYADLHRLDIGSHDRIIVTMPPDTAPWQALRDRLTRAANTE